jgi:hypothetical protein
MEAAAVKRARTDGQTAAAAAGCEKRAKAKQDEEEEEEEGRGGQQQPHGHLSQHMSSVVLIEVTCASPNYLQPWQMHPQEVHKGSGFVIAGQRIITNFHVIQDAIDVRLRKHGEPGCPLWQWDSPPSHLPQLPPHLLLGAAAGCCWSVRAAGVCCYCVTAPRVPVRVHVHVLRVAWCLWLPPFLGVAGEHSPSCPLGVARRWRGKVVVSAHDVDLAIVTVHEEEDGNGDSFWDGLRPSELDDELPALQSSVHVVGFPTGGSTICVTQGVVSRIDCKNYRLGYTSTHNPGRLLVIQIDAAIKCAPRSLSLSLSLLCVCARARGWDSGGVGALLLLWGGAGVVPV